MNHKTKGNDTLRKRLKTFLKKMKSGEEIYTNHIILVLSKTNKNFSLSSARITNLLKENPAVALVKSGVWMKV